MALALDWLSMVILLIFTFFTFDGEMFGAIDSVCYSFTERSVVPFPSEIYPFFMFIFFFLVALMSWVDSMFEAFISPPNCEDSRFLLGE